MVRKAAVKLTDNYAFTLDISVDLFCDEPWSNLGEKVTFYIDPEESMEMFEKHAKIWKWKIPKKKEKAVLKTKTKTIVKTRKLANSSPDTLSTWESTRKLKPQYFFVYLTFYKKNKLGKRRLKITTTEFEKIICGGSERALSPRKHQRRNGVVQRRV